MLTAVVASSLAVGLYSSASLQDALFKQAVAAGLSRESPSLYSEDGLKVVLCGTSSNVLDPARGKSCTAVVVDGRYFVVDIGPGSARNLQNWKFGGRRLSGVFLTHFHSDHIGDLGELNSFARGNGHVGRLQVYGGPGVERVVGGFNEAYALDASYRASNGDSPPSSTHEAVMAANIIGLKDGTVGARRSAPLHFGALTVTAIEVDHAPVSPAYAYRFDYKGRSVVVSGDTAYHPQLALGARGVDVLIHEAQPRYMIQLVETVAREKGDLPTANLMRSIQRYHTDPAQAAAIANAAQAHLLVFNHVSPPLTNFFIRTMFVRGVEKVRQQPWIIGKDGTTITMRVGKSDVRVGAL